jgi:hypothetical protein
VEGRKVVAAFDGGQMTSDAGAMLLGATNKQIRLIERFAGCFTDYRVADLVEHTVSPIAIASSIGTNNTYLLWHHTSGYTNIWLLDVNLNYVTSYVIPPIAGWTADGLTINAASNRVQVSWTHITGAYATWEFDPLLTGAVGGPSYGPYPPWSPGPTE